MNQLFKNAETNDDWKRNFEHQLKYAWFYDIVFEFKLFFIVIRSII